VQSHFAAYCYAGFVGSDAIGLTRQAQSLGEYLEPFAGFPVKEMFLRLVIGAGFIPIDGFHGLSPDVKKPAR
jgi:hypothetical protein